jgi:UDP-N-acetyl-D-mannosaminuronate dehydrogenase
LLVAVIGLGWFGFKLAATLAEKGAEVIAIDINRTLVDGIEDLMEKGGDWGVGHVCGYRWERKSSLGSSAPWGW